MQRREFVINGLQSGITLSLLPLFATLDVQAQVTPGALPSYFISIHVAGGWDISLCTDPWLAEVRPQESDYFLEYRRDELIPFADSFVGPALAPLKKHFSRMTLINGVFVNSSDNGHDGGRIYMETGNGQGQRPHITTELDYHGLHSPLGTGASAGAYAGNENRVVFDLNTIVASKGIKGVEDVLVYQKTPTELSNSIQSLRIHRDKIEVFNKFLSGVTAPLNVEQVVAAGLVSELSKSAALTYSGGADPLDSHAQHVKSHLRGLNTVFTKVNELLELLEKTETSAGSGAKLLDRTTVMLYSEFCRTPALNASAGKEHNPQNNSVMIFSPNLKSKKIGAAKLVDRRSSKIGQPYLIGLPVRKDGGVAQTREEAAFMLRPETVLATIAKGMNLDPSQFSEGLGKAPVLENIL